MEANWQWRRMGEWARDLGAMAWLFAIGLAATLGLIVLCGYPAGAAALALARGSILTRDGLATTLVSAIPLAFTGLAVALAFRAGALNIGAEGQFLAGALAATVAGTFDWGCPRPLALAAALAAGAAAGAAAAALAGALRAARGIPEVISTIMLNFIALEAVSFAVHGPLMVPGTGLPQSAPLPPEVRFRAFSSATDLHTGLWLAAASVGAVAILLSRTTLGFRIRAVGAGAEAARHAGISANWTVFWALALSGALAGLGGAVELTGVTHRLYENFSPGYGYTGIAVAMLGRLKPVGVAAAALFFGALAAGSGEMQRSADIPSVMVFAAQGVVIAFCAAAWRKKSQGEKAKPNG